MNPAHDYQITPNWWVSLSEASDIVEKRQAIPSVPHPSSWPIKSKPFFFFLALKFLDNLLHASSEQNTPEHLDQMLREENDPE